MNRFMIYSLAAVLLIIPVAYLIYLWPQLPATVPIHFGLDGKPDDWGSKNQLITSIAVMDFISAGSLLLLLNLHKIDPKKHKNSPAVMAKIAVAVVLLLTLIQLMIIDSARTSSIKFDQFFLPILGLFFAFLGNVFYSVKPNYFVGIRTPWALENEQNWRKTHQLAGKLWFAAGLFSMLLTLLLPFHIAIIVFMVITVVISLIPFLYSYKLYKRSKIN